jgi:hypothetical protein
MKCILNIFLLACFFISNGQENSIPLFRAENGHVKFTSDAPLELITAESNHLRGLVDPAKRTFAFQLEIITLKGFNSALQQEHFYENYMETELYPTAEFSGKIIEKIDFETNGTQAIRAKGILYIHGIKQERIINCQLNIVNNQIIVTSEFIVNLADFNITIPKLVYQKIAEEIRVSINVSLVKSLD